MLPFRRLLAPTISLIRTFSSSPIMGLAVVPKASNVKDRPDEAYRVVGLSIPPFKLHDLG